MRVIRAAVVVVIVALSGRGAAQEELPRLVEAALKEEVAAFDEMNARFEKGKLKPGEAQLLFGKKKLTKEQQRERMNELAGQVAAGEISFRTLDLSAEKLKVGDCGCLRLRGQTSIYCQQVVGKQELLGSYSASSASGRAVWSRQFLFRGIAGSSELIDREYISITEPLIVSGRYTYETAGGGTNTTLAIESLASAAKRLRDADAKKKKKK